MPPSISVPMPQLQLQGVKQNAVLSRGQILNLIVIRSSWTSISMQRLSGKSVSRKKSVFLCVVDFNVFLPSRVVNVQRKGFPCPCPKEFLGFPIFALGHGQFHCKGSLAEILFVFKGEKLEYQKIRFDMDKRNPPLAPSWPFATRRCWLICTHI